MRWYPLCLLTACLAAAACRTEHPAHVSDARHAISLPDEDAAAVRAEMRVMLKSLQELLSGLASRDTAVLRAAAQASGTGAAADTALEALLPPAFIALGMATHRGFDSLAIAISSGATGDSIAARLGRITTSCVACHAQYRLVGRNPT